MKKAKPDEPQTFEEIILKCTPECRVNIDDLRETMVPRLETVAVPAPKGKGKGKERKPKKEDKSTWDKGTKGAQKRWTKKDWTKGPTWGRGNYQWPNQGSQWYQDPREAQQQPAPGAAP